MRSFGLCFTFAFLSYTLAAPFDRRQQQSYAPSDTSDGSAPYQSSGTADLSLERPHTESTSHGPLPYVPSDSQICPHSDSQNCPHRSSATGNGELPPSAQPGRSSSYAPQNDYNAAQSSPTYPSQGPSAADYSQQHQSPAGYPSEGQSPSYGPEEIPPPSQAVSNGHTGQASLHNGTPSTARANSAPSSDRFLPDFGTLTKDIPKEATLPATLTAPPSSEFRLNGTHAKGGPHVASGQSQNNVGPNMTALADPTRPPYVPPDAAEFANKSYVPSTPDAPRNLSNMPASVKQPSKDMQAESTSSHSLEGMPPAVLPTANGTQDHRSNMTVTLPDQSKPIFAELPKRQFTGSPRKQGNVLSGGLGSNMLPDAGMLTPGVLPGSNVLGGGSHRGAGTGPGGPAGPAGSNPHGGRGPQPYSNGANYPSAANGRPGPDPVAGGPSYAGGPSAQSIAPGGDVVPSGPVNGVQYSGGPSYGGPAAQGDEYGPPGGIGSGGIPPGGIAPGSMPLGSPAVSPGGAGDSFDMPISAQSDPYRREQGSAPGTMQQSESYMPPTTSKTDHGYRTAGQSSMHEGNAGGPAYNKPYTGETSRW